MAIRLPAWLRLNRVRSSRKILPRETTSRGTNTQPTPRVQRETPGVQKDTPPPPYNILDLLCSNSRPPRDPDEDMTVEALRARNPSTRRPGQDPCNLHLPPHRPTPTGAATAAASSALIGVVRALDEEDRRMVAARTAQAIAVAASTARSYSSFVAAVTAAESTAFLILEDHRDGIPNDRRRDRVRHAIRTAVDTAMAADADINPRAWPFNVDYTHSRSPRNGDVTNAKRCHVDPRQVRYSCKWEAQCPCREDFLHLEEK